MAGHGLAKAAMQRLIWVKRGKRNCKKHFLLGGNPFGSL